MKTIIADTAYGYQELRQVHQRYMMLAMLAAITIQMSVIGGYYMSERLKTTDDMKKPRVGPVIDIIPIPPLNPINTCGIIPVIAANLGKGIPIPIPDAIVDTSIKYASQTELSGIANNAYTNISEGLNDGTIVIPPVDNDPLPDAWVPVEIYPVIVTRVVPEYPDVAERINLEGDVFVKVMVDKKGIVKKAQLLKASDDIFVESALNAAKNWTFTPAIMQGKPVIVWVSIPFRFRLTKM